MSQLQKLRTIVFDKNMNLVIKSDPMYQVLFGNITSLTDFNTFLAKNTMLDETFLKRLDLNGKEYHVCYKTVDKADTYEFHFFLLSDDWVIVDPTGRQDIYDQLTGLQTERSALSLIRHEIKRHSRDKSIYTAIVADVAHLKDINEAFGFLAGDTIIKKVADTLKTTTRGSDVIGRYKGDKFIIVLYKTDLEGTKHYIKKFEAALNTTKFHFNDVYFHAKLNYGVSHCVEDDSVDFLLERLQNSLLKSKKENPIPIEYFSMSEETY